jgi:hypothetical protein
MPQAVYLGVTLGCLYVRGCEECADGNISDVNQYLHRLLMYFVKADPSVALVSSQEGEDSAFHCALKRCVVYAHYRKQG